MTGTEYPCPWCVNGLNNRTVGVPGFVRVLVTGWRFWPRKDLSIVHDVLFQVRAYYPPETVIVVVEGMCPRGGVDEYAYQWAEGLGFSNVLPERHPGIYTAGRFWGPERNSHMVSLGVDVALSFPESGTKQTGGTWDCTRKIQATGLVPVVTPYKP